MNFIAKARILQKAYELINLVLGLCNRSIVIGKHTARCKLQVDDGFNLRYDLNRLYFILLKLLFVISILFNCGITKDADCEKQKSDESKCLRAFLLFCSQNKTLVQCDGGLESILTIGSVCKVGAKCQSSSEDVTTEKIVPEALSENK